MHQNDPRERTVPLGMRDERKDAGRVALVRFAGVPDFLHDDRFIRRKVFAPLRLGGFFERFQVPNLRRFARLKEWD